ncbi:ankyrin repeat [Fusarium beomiforme]|uniref:Ankyrin repeat n=1 Tax=Fusarium beomiforme TaxID=44412 RepID=A0A9P5DQC4_9HYPO|nr:ankyrin repeat [Fusarium beomiforme]
MEHGNRKPATVPALSALTHKSFAVLDQIVGYAKTLDTSALCVTLEDEQGRFRVWASNLGALQPPDSAKSLDQRLKDAPLMKRSIASGLERLQLSAERVSPVTALAILSGSTPNRPASSISSSPDGSDAQATNELDELILSVRSSVNHLFGLSMLIRRQRPRGRLPDLDEITLESSPDISYVTDKFPKAKSTQWLARRLGNKITRQRNLIQYRQHHRQSLAQRHVKGPNPADTATLADTVVATTFQEADNSWETQHTPQDVDSSRMSAFTSATSFLSLEDGTTMGRSIPDLSDMTLDGVQLEYGVPFECPYCRTIQKVMNRYEWNAGELKKHFNDSHTGIATESQMEMILEACERPIKSFGPDSCPFCADWKPLSVKDNGKSFSRHLARHLQQLALESLPLAIEGLEVKDADGTSEEGSLSDSSSDVEAVRNWVGDLPADMIDAKDIEMDLDMAAAAGREALIQALVEHGMDVNSRDDIGRTLLCRAAVRGQRPTVQTILDCGADPDIKDLRGRTAMRLAADNGHESVVALFLERGLKLNENQDTERSAEATGESVLEGKGSEARPAEDIKGPEAVTSETVTEKVNKLESPGEPLGSKAEQDTLAHAQYQRMKDLEAAAAEVAARKAAEELIRKVEEDAKVMLEKSKKKAELAPIRFKDAVGRKFSFPFHLCATWQGMEELIKQAFMHVDVLGPHVREGHYDLIGPDDEIILPSVWEKVIQPGWDITMKMWPMEDKVPPLKSEGASQNHGRGTFFNYPPEVWSSAQKNSQEGESATRRRLIPVGPSSRKKTKHRKANPDKVEVLSNKPVNEEPEARDPEIAD